MQDFTRFIAKLPSLLILFLYFIQRAQMTHKWKSLSQDLPYEYIFSTDYRETRDWYDARRWCKENGGGDLLTIKSQLEARTINTELKKTQSSFKAHWIGLQDLNNDGIWTWFDGTEFVVNITKKSGIVFRPTTVGHPKLCVFLQSQFWLLLPGMTNTPTLRTSFCPFRNSFICKRNATSAIQNPSVSSDWKDYLPSDYSKNFPTFCPLGFIDLPKKCVRVEQNSTTSLTWQQAGSFCRDQYGNQSYLLSFHDDDEVLDLSVHMPSEKAEYWIGFSPLTRRNNFWYDNTKVNNNSWFTFNLGEQHRWMNPMCCYIIQNLQSVQFAAGNCFLRKNFICQINKNTAVSSPVNIVSKDFTNVTNCPPGFSFATTKSCYELISEKMDFKRAELFCNKRNDSHLTSVESNTEDILLQRIAEFSNVTQLWLGLQLQETPQMLDTGKSLFYWNDGYPVFYDKWLNVHDNNAANKSKSCVTHERATQWVTSSCDETYPFICKIKLDRSDQLVNKEDGTFCPNYWVPFGSHCYLFTANTQSTWREAAEECIHFNMNSTLTSITSDLEVQFLKYIVQGNEQSGVWTGVYLNRNNIPTSIDGTTFSLAGHEHSGKFPGNCGILTPSDQPQNILWTDCNQKYGYVCKIQKIQQKNFATTNVTSAGCSSNEWVRFDDHCYLFLPDQFLTWTQAHLLCSGKSEDFNADLVSIHSLKENHFVQMTLHDRTKLPFYRWSWIGYYTDRDSSDSSYVWQWTDKTSLDYHNWKISSWSSPSIHKQESVCVAMDTVSGIWATKPCTELHGVVCKIPFSKVSTGSGPETTSRSLSTSDPSQIVEISSQNITSGATTTIAQTSTIRAEGQAAENYIQNKGRKSSFPAISVIVVVGISLLILILIFIIAVLLLRNRLPRSLIFCCKRSTRGTSLPENSEYINTDELRNFDELTL